MTQNTRVPLRRLSTWPERKIADDENNIQKINAECRSKAFPFFLWTKYLQLPCAIPPHPPKLLLHSLAVAFPFILLHIYVLTSAFSVSFLSLATHLVALIIHPNAERLYVYLIIYCPPDLQLKAAIEADITICLSCFCVWAAVWEKIMGIASRKNWRKHTLKQFCCTLCPFHPQHVGKFQKLCFLFFSCVIMNMERSVRMFWGTLLISEVTDNFLGVDCLMTGDACLCACVICIFHDKSGDEMHFWVLNLGHSKISAAHTDLALYMTWDRPEQLIKCVWCETHNKQGNSSSPVLNLWDAYAFCIAFKCTWHRAAFPGCWWCLTIPVRPKRASFPRPNPKCTHTWIWQYGCWTWYREVTSSKTTIADAPGFAKTKLGC